MLYQLTLMIPSSKVETKESSIPGFMVFHVMFPDTANFPLSTA
jgi:hypothetical protein